MRTLPGFATAVLMLSTTASAQIRINEIRTNDPAVPDNDEYFELAGPPNASLAGYSYIVLGDGPNGNSGVVEFVIDLSFSTPTLAANGLVVQEFGVNFVYPQPCPCDGPGCTAHFFYSGANAKFENDDNVTHMLVTDFTGNIDDDLDTDDDGILDVTPWSQIVDSVALFDNPSSELMYSPTVVGPDPNTGGQPWHVYYCESSGWQIGIADPVCVSDTKGDVNDACQPVAVESLGWGVIKARYR
jgi:hypothetical protein